MKILRNFGASIVSLLIFALLFLLVASFAAESFIKDDLLKSTMMEAIEKNDSSKELINQHKDAINKMFGDGESGSIINMVIKNYQDYKGDRENYNVSKDDVKKVYDFVLKYRNEIKELSGEDISKMSEKEFEEFFDQEEVNKIARDAFGEFDSSLDNEVVDIGLKVYTIGTSTMVRVIAVVAIIVLIILWCLLKGSFIKWMLTIGLHTISAGVVMIAIYFIVNMFKNSMVKDALKMTKEINLSSFLTAGIIEIIVGVLLIIAYIVICKIIKKKQQKQISNIQPIDYNKVQVSTVPFNAENNTTPTEVPSSAPTDSVSSSEPVVSSEPPVSETVPSPEPVQEVSTEPTSNVNEE
jgi:hypothetical protein